MRYALPKILYLSTYLFMMEMDEQDRLKLEMLRTALKRFLILCVRIYHQKRFDVGSESKKVGI